MEIGQQLSPQRKRDAQAIGVQQIGVVRIMLSYEIPLPESTSVFETSNFSTLLSYKQPPAGRQYYGKKLESSSPKTT